MKDDESLGEDDRNLICAACDLNSPLPEEGGLLKAIETLGQQLKVAFRKQDAKDTAVANESDVQKRAQQNWRRSIYVWITEARECRDAPLTFESNSKYQRTRKKTALERLIESQAIAWDLSVEKQGSTRLVVREGGANDTTNPVALEVFFAVHHAGEPNAASVLELIRLFKTNTTQFERSYSKEFDCFSDLIRTIDRLIERLRQHNKRSEALTAAMHVRRKGQTQDEATRIALELSQRKFDEYKNSLRGNSGNSCLLISDSTDRQLRHRILCEAIGESRHCLPGAAFHPIISRIWTTLPTPRIGDEFEDLIDGVLCDSDGESHITIPVDPHTVSISDFARRLLWKVEEKHGPNALVLHWQCNTERTVDLLRPIDESLWRLMGFFRRSSFSDKPYHRHADIGQHLKTVAKGALGDDEFDELRDNMIALLAGSTETDSFVKISDSIKMVLAHFEQNSPLHIVVEAAEFADELMMEIVHNLKGAIGDRDFHVYWIEGTGTHPRPKQIDSEPAKSENGYGELLQLAAYLGFDFQLAWLEDCWEQCGRDPENLELCLDQALQDGLLQFSDSLVVKAPDKGESSGYKLCRQLRWVSSETHAMYMERLNEGQRRVFEDAFYRSVAVDDDGRPIPISNLRLRTRIFELLRTQSNLTRSKCDQLAKLGYFLGRRVARCGERSEAGRRLREAIKAWERGSKKPELGRKLALEQVALWTSSRHVPGKRGKPELAFARKQLEAFRDELHDRNRLEWFELARMVCSAEVWAGDLLNAERDAKLLEEIAGDYEGPKFESWHLHAVTSFALGKLEQCRDSASKGLEFCERHRTMALRYPRLNLYGNHDGRVCAKVFFGLSEFLMTGTDPSEWLSKASEFARTEGTLSVAKESECVAGSYHGIFHLLNEDFQKVEDVCVSLRAINPDHKQWALVAELTNDCAEIAQTFIRGSENVDLRGRIAKHRAEWDINEYDTLWLTFAGVANFCHSGDFDTAQRSFDQALSIADLTSQRVFLPLLYLWRSRLAVRANLSEVANDSLNVGKTLAEDMRADHYLNLLKADAVRLSGRH